MKKTVTILLMTLALVACKKDTPVTHRIIAITAASGIGDHGYLDVVVKGFESVYLNRDESTFMHIFTPFTIDEAYEIALHNIESAKDGVPTLILFGSVEYLPFVDSLRADPSLTGSNVSLLVFEVDSLSQARNDINFYTFMITAYGACYNAGKYVATKGFKNPLIWLSTPIDASMDDFRDGFSDGYFDVTGLRPDVKYLADDLQAYNMPDSAYRAMYALSEEYDFIFPVLGGSNIGIYRYLRENPDGPYVAGMDVDQGHYANNIVGSIIKHVDDAIVDFVNEWMAGEKIPSHQFFDSSSGYIEWYVTREPLMPQ